MSARRRKHDTAQRVSPALDPVRSDAVLRIRERHLASANFCVKLVLKLILFGPSWPGRVRLGP
jgi:hypothetical protein